MADSAPGFREGLPELDMETRRPVPFLTLGIDTTEISMVLARQLRMMTEGTADDADYQVRAQQAGRRTVHGRP
ncbi:MAG TPA: hypothetical protein VFR35_17480 [Actinoplanes sp.]|nr:hypothetical protein [Actinoplanes sp.]